MPTQLPRLDHCLNCGSAVAGNYCPDCGQENENRTAALGPLLSDFFAEVASFDSKLFRTIVPLLCRPGYLTNAYIEGKRVRFLSPLKMYLVASVAFFLVVAYSVPLGSSGDASTVPNSHQRSSQSPSEKRGTGSNSVSAGARGMRVASVSLPDVESEEDYDGWLARPENRGKHSRFEQFITRHSLRVKDDPTQFGERMLDNIPKMMFLLLPIFALLLKVIYFRSKRLYVEHLIFALHCHAFVFFVFAIAELIPARIALVSALLWAMIYLFLAMRRVYRQSILKTILKYSILSASYLFILSICLLGVLFVTFAMTPKRPGTSTRISSNASPTCPTIWLPPFDKRA